MNTNRNSNIIWWVLALASTIILFLVITVSGILFNILEDKTVIMITSGISILVCTAVAILALINLTIKEFIRKE